MKTELGRVTPRPTIDRRPNRARTTAPTAAGLNRTVRRAVRAGLVSRGTACTGAPQKRLSILPAGSAAELAVDNTLNKIVFGLFALSGLVLGMTCYWNLQALVTRWESFEAVCRTALQG